MIENEDQELYQEYASEVLEHCERTEALLLELQEAAITRSNVDELFRSAHSIKGGGMALDVPMLPDFVHVWEDVMSRSRSLEFPFRVHDDILTLFLECNDTVRAFVSSKTQDPDHWAPKLGRLTEKLELIGELDYGATRGDVAEGEGENDDAQGGTKADAPGSDETIRVRLDRVDLLIRRIGELAVQQQLLAGRLKDTEDPQIDSDSRKLGQLAGEAHDIAMSLRMVPVRPTIQTLRRTCRDTALKLGKKVRFIAEGEGVELDLALVQVLSDALVHMVRNAVDHGIEMPDKRLEAGKEENAQLTVAVAQKGGGIEIEVIDDGKGMDADVIRKKGIEKGLISEDAVLNNDQIYELLFRPGFSTSATVTEFSGRGVGLDVVASSIRELDGSVHVHSELGKGSKMTVRVPLSVAVVDVMRVTMEGQHYLIPLHTIHETVAVSQDNLQKAAVGTTAMVIRGQAVPVQELYGLLTSKDRRELQLRGRNVSAIVTEWQQRPLALTVDDILGRQKVVIKPLGQELANIPGISGSAILGDGRVGLIIDLPGLISAKGYAAAA